MTSTDEKPNLKTIKEFFGMSLGEMRDEWTGKDQPDHKRLTIQDRAQIWEGIRNGSLTY